MNQMHIDKVPNPTFVFKKPIYKSNFLYFFAEFNCHCGLCLSFQQKRDQQWKEYICKNLLSISPKIYNL